jgi:tRNA modification GTPase
LGEEAALVTDIPGTTRDSLEGALFLDGLPLAVIDTAGIRATDGLIERLGIAKSQEKIAQADLLLIMLDSARALADEDRELLAARPGLPRLVILNKSDLSPAFLPAELAALGVAAEEIVSISVQSGEGWDSFLAALRDKAAVYSPGEGLYVTEERHRACLARAAAALREAGDTLRGGLPLDLVTIDLRAAYAAIGEILGVGVDDAVIDEIFSRFCLGK